MRRRAVAVPTEGAPPENLRRFEFDQSSLESAGCFSSAWRQQYREWRRAQREWVEAGGSEDHLRSLVEDLDDAPFCGKVGCCL